MNWRPYYHKLIAQLADLLTVMFSFFVSYRIWELIYKFIPTRFISPPVDYSYNPYLILPFYGILFVWILSYQGAYSFQRFTAISKEIEMVLDASFIWALLGSVIFYLVTHVFIQRSFLVIEFGMIIGLMILQKLCMFFVAQYMRTKGYNRRRVLIAGNDKHARNFIELVKNRFHWGLDIIGVLSENEEEPGAFFSGIPVLGVYSDIEKVLKEYNPEEVMITISTFNYARISEVFNACMKEGVQVRINSDFLSPYNKNLTYSQIYGQNIISLKNIDQNEFQIIVKRIIDIAGSLIALALFLPLMLVAAFGILITDGAPVFYNWNVVGLNKKPFRSWKFRTMIRNADQMKIQLLKENEMQGPVFKIENDPRIIPFGKWLRKWSIDETPQFFSVLIGDMSLVGPRPAGPHELINYDSWHRRKLSIKPGITCLWQVSGRNAIRNFDEWVRLDLEYIDNWSIKLDFVIILKTIVTVFKGNGR